MCCIFHTVARTLYGKYNTVIKSQQNDHYAGIYIDNMLEYKRLKIISVLLLMYVPRLKVDHTC